MRKRNKCNFNHHYFDVIDTSEKSYWLGFIMADGTVQDTCKKGSMQLHIHIANRDLIHLYKFNKAIDSNNKISICGDGSVKSYHSSDILCEALISHGCTPRKSLTLKFPNIQENLLSHFVRGYFDGDGSVCLHKGRLFIQFQGTKEFIDVLQEKIGTNYKPQNPSNIYQIGIGSIGHCKRISSWMYENSTIHLERKKEIIDLWNKTNHPGRGFRKCVLMNY